LVECFIIFHKLNASTPPREYFSTILSDHYFISLHGIASLEAIFVILHDLVWIIEWYITLWPGWGLHAYQKNIHEGRRSVMLTCHWS
jgi:hypothetical protein